MTKTQANVLLDALHAHRKQIEDAGRTPWGDCDGCPESTIDGYLTAMGELEEAATAVLHGDGAQ